MGPAVIAACWRWHETHKSHASIAVCWPTHLLASGPKLVMCKCWREVREEVAPCCLASCCMLPPCDNELVQCQSHCHLLARALAYQVCPNTCLQPSCGMPIGHRVGVRSVKATTPCVSTLAASGNVMHASTMNNHMRLNRCHAACVCRCPPLRLRLI